MNGDIGNGMINSTLIETDLDGNLMNNSEMPFWLRDIIERAFSASGIRINRKVASKDAIASLQDVDPKDLTGETCPICYDAYVLGKNKKMKVNPEQQPGDIPLVDQISQSLERCGVSVPLQTDNKEFRDPSLFLPVDSTAIHHLRFPPKNLYSGRLVTEAEMFPSLKLQKSAVFDTLECEHVPVSMPNCGHTFGKPCIIEWLNGHVSCPLCRKEVEAIKDSDALSKKIATIRENCNFVFTQDSKEIISHIANNLTDVFNPHRKTMNPSVTPLTDASVPQVWAASLYPSTPHPQSWTSSWVDPPLIMTRKFPLSHFGREPPTHPISSMLGPSTSSRPAQSNVRTTARANREERGD